MSTGSVMIAVLVIRAYIEASVYKFRSSSYIIEGARQID